MVGAKSKMFYAFDVDGDDILIPINDLKIANTFQSVIKMEKGSAREFDINHIPVSINKVSVKEITYL